MTERSQFDAALRRAPACKTAHFALHLVPGLAQPSEPLSGAGAGAGASGNATTGALFPGPEHWVGVVLPKRWARRAVTRNLLRRQIYAAALALPPSQPPLALVVRLRTAFATSQFPSAASAALRRCACAELQQLLEGLRRA